MIHRNNERFLAYFEKCELAFEVFLFIIKTVTAVQIGQEDRAANGQYMKNALNFWL
jgi:hypothetical protein